MKRIHLSAFSVLLYLIANTAYSMPIVSPSGVNGLEVDGTFYNIAIGDMSGKTTTEVYAGYGLSMSPSPLLSDINVALAAVLNAGFFSADFFNGCDNFLCVIVMPTKLHFSDAGRTQGSVQRIGAGRPWEVDPLGTSHSSGTGASVIYTYGVITPNTVPAPTTLVLFGLGLSGLVWSRRQKT